MPRNTVDILENDRVLFWRCRRLNEEVTHLLQHKQPDTTLNSLKRVLLAELSPEERQKVKTAVARIERDNAELKRLQAELDQISQRAEQAAERIENLHLRRFARLYCIDEWKVRDAASESGVTLRTAARYTKLLNKPPDSMFLEEASHGRQTDQKGSDRR